MSAFRVVTTAQARRHLEEKGLWASENEASVSRLVKAIERALNLLAYHPGIGTAVPAEPGLFRLRLKGTKYQMFFRINAPRCAVYVVALWHTSRGDRPPL